MFYPVADVRVRRIGEHLLVIVEHRAIPGVPNGMNADLKAGLDGAGHQRLGESVVVAGHSAVPRLITVVFE